MPPRVSVLLPFRDAAATLPRALESLRAQTFRDFELLALDHGSSDGAGLRLALPPAPCAQVRVQTFSRALPFADLLNAGLAMAQGDLIARMDADDTAHPERLRLQVEHLDRHPDVGVVASRVQFGGAAAGYARHVDWGNTLLTHEDLALARFRESPLAHPSVLFRRAQVARYGGYRDGDFPEDYELWLRWFEAGVRFEKRPETLLTWNDPPGRLSRVDPRYAIEKFYAVKAGYLARWLAANNPHHPHITVVGSGRITRRRVDFLKAEGIVVDAWADIDRRKAGRILDGAPVIHHDDLPPGAFVVPFVASIGAADHIRAMLERRGFARGRSFIEAA